ncbi:hypothetical protein AMTRI_Chr12g241120 [Amborella trichopoda]
MEEIRDFEDDVLSLCDLPIEKGEERESFLKERRSCKSLAEMEYFEFFRDATAEMCDAEDLFFHGGFLPLRSNRELAGSHQSSFEPRVERPVDHRRLRTYSYPSPSHRKLHRSSTSIPPFSGTKPRENRNFPEKSDFPTRSRGQFLMIGLVKAPEIQLRDIKFRQRRRNPAIFERSNSSRVCVREEKGCKGAWKLLRALSCKGHARDMVSASLGCIRHV